VWRRGVTGGAGADGGDRNRCRFDTVREQSTPGGPSIADVLKAGKTITCKASTPPAPVR